MTGTRERALELLERHISNGRQERTDPAVIARECMVALEGLGYRPTAARPTADWKLRAAGPAMSEETRAELDALKQRSAEAAAEQRRNDPAQGCRMTTPDPLKAVAMFQHRVRAGDYAAAALMVSQPAVLDALAGMARYADRQRAEADAARREAAAVRLAEAERARVQASIAPLMDELIGVLAGALGMPRGAVCITCKRVLRRYRNCPYCGTRDARSAAPVSADQASRNRVDRRAAA